MGFIPLLLIGGAHIVYEVEENPFARVPVVFEPRVHTIDPVPAGGMPDVHSQERVAYQCLFVRTADHVDLHVAEGHVHAGAVIALFGIYGIGGAAPVADAFLILIGQAVYRLGPLGIRQRRTGARFRCSRGLRRTGGGGRFGPRCFGRDGGSRAGGGRTGGGGRRGRRGGRSFRFRGLLRLNGGRAGRRVAHRRAGAYRTFGSAAGKQACRRQRERTKKREPIFSFQIHHLIV